MANAHFVGTGFLGIFVEIAGSLGGMGKLCVDDNHSQPVLESLILELLEIGFTADARHPIAGLGTKGIGCQVLLVYSAESSLDTISKPMGDIFVSGYRYQL